MPITTADIQTLEQHYRIEAPNVLDFVREHTFLYPILIEAVDVIRGQFPTATLALAVDDWEEEIPRQELMLMIVSSLSVEEAMRRLSIIDRTWLIPNARSLQNRFNLHLRFN